MINLWKQRASSCKKIEYANETVRGLPLLVSLSKATNELWQNFLMIREYSPQGMKS